jgi:hypothetical protein
MRARNPYSVPIKRTRYDSVASARLAAQDNMSCRL